MDKGMLEVWSPVAVSMVAAGVAGWVARRQTQAAEDQTREARRSATVGFQKSACPSDRVIWVSCGIPKVGHLR
jgi:hypothetical protein